MEEKKISWFELYPKNKQPELKEIDEYIANPLWGELKEHIEENYNSAPESGYSRCSGAPGWNLKYKKGGKALCTIYPDDGFFTCLISVSPAMEQAFEGLYPTFSEHIRELYDATQPSKMG